MLHVLSISDLIAFSISNKKCPWKQIIHRRTTIAVSVLLRVFICRQYDLLLLSSKTGLSSPLPRSSFTTDRSKAVPLLFFFVCDFTCGVCGVLICSSSLLPLMPGRAVLCDCSISWVPPLIFCRAAQ